jgi:hypothetical protein
VAGAGQLGDLFIDLSAIGFDIRACSRFGASTFFVLERQSLTRGLVAFDLCREFSAALAQPIEITVFRWYNRFKFADACAAGIKKTMRFIAFC